MSTDKKLSTFQTENLAESLADSTNMNLPFLQARNTSGVSNDALKPWLPAPENLYTLKYPVNIDQEKTQTVIRLNRILPKQDRFISLQKWEGAILEVKENTFIARLVDLTHSNIDEEAEFSIEEISPNDIPLLKQGAVFYWNIGYLDQRTGQRIRASIIRFRRLPAWTSKEIQQMPSR